MYFHYLCNLLTGEVAQHRPFFFFLNQFKQRNVWQFDLEKIEVYQKNLN